MNMPVRTFEIRQAKRERVPLLIGLMGASGSGKTVSALRLATGIKSVTGGDIHYIDTESKRALHYADFFDFKHVQFVAPFSPLDYLAAIQASIKAGAGVIVVDSLSHEHEGPGGVLEMHETELNRIAGDDRAKRERANLLAWAKPKADRRHLINGLMQMNCNFIFCFRAKEKVKPVKDKNGKSQIEQQGWMPIAGEEFVYEQTINCLLMPGSKGVPTWQSNNPGERAMMKLPGQFRKIFEEPVQLSENIGRQLAEWAKGGAVEAGSADAMKDDAVGQPPTEQASEHVTQDGEIVNDFSAADAFEMGKAARKKGDKREPPQALEEETWKEAWQAGWDEQDAAVRAKTKG